mgnify:CR=1 FL=1
MKELMNKVREEFQKRLQNQSNWGKNQIEQLYIEVERDVYLEYLNNVMGK